nr:hypothetical protein [Tanacetum cinerariifolium]
FSQRLSGTVQPSQSFAPDSGATAEDFDSSKATRRGDVGASAGNRLSEAQLLALPDEKAAPRRHRAVIEHRAQIRSRQCEAAIGFGDQGQAAEGNFNNGRIEGVAEQFVHAQMADAKPSGILKQAQRRTAFYGKHSHASASSAVSSPPRRMNSA